MKVKAGVVVQYVVDGGVMKAPPRYNFYSNTIEKLKIYSSFILIKQIIRVKYFKNEI